MAGYVERLCRVCGSMLSSSSRYEVCSFTSQLEQVFKVDFTGEGPTSFCIKCYDSLSNYELRGSKPLTTPLNWGEIKGEELLATKARGGRPRKKKNLGRKKLTANTSPEALTDILKLSPSKPIPKIVEQCLSHVIHIKMLQSSMPNNSVQLATKGPQVIFLKQGSKNCKFVEFTSHIYTQ